MAWSPPAPLLAQQRHELLDYPAGREPGPTSLDLGEVRQGLLFYGRAAAIRPITDATLGPGNGDLGLPARINQVTVHPTTTTQARTDNLLTDYGHGQGPWLD